MSDNNTKTILGLSENLEAVICYMFGWISGVLFLILEKNNSFVRFHAMQSLATFLGLFVLSTIASFIPIVGWMIAIVSAPVSIMLWMFLMYKAYLGEKYKLPFIGDWVEKQIDNYPI